MQPLPCDGADEITVLASMGDHMADFKTLIDTAKPGVMGQLCQRYPGFHQYAKVFKHIAGAIQSGATTVPR